MNSNATSSPNWSRAYGLPIPDERQGAQCVLYRLRRRDDLSADVDRRLGKLGVAGQNTDKPTGPPLVEEENVKPGPNAP
jgi:hypothetical protein